MSIKSPALVGFALSLASISTAHAGFVGLAPQVLTQAAASVPFEPNQYETETAATSSSIAVVVSNGASIATARARADLATGKLGVQTAISPTSGNASAYATARFQDRLAFSFPSLASGETVDIGVRLDLHGSLSINGRVSFGMGLVSSPSVALADSLSTDSLGLGISYSQHGQPVVSGTGGDGLLYDFDFLYGLITLVGPNPALDLIADLEASGNASFFNTATFSFMGLPLDATFTSVSGVFLTSVSADIPEPSSAVGLVGGLVFAGYWRARRRSPLRNRSQPLAHL